MKAPLSCLTCRMIRRFLMAFAIGGMLTWQLTGTLPSGVSTTGWRGQLTAAGASKRNRNTPCATNTRRGSKISQIL